MPTSVTFISSLRINLTSSDIKVHHLAQLRLSPFHVFSKRRDVQTRNSWISDASVAQPQGCRPRISRRRYCGEYENPGLKTSRTFAPIPIFIAPLLPSADNNKLNPKAVYAGFSSLNGKRNTSPASDPYLRSPLRLHIQRKALTFHAQG